jgi:hypothetical protein
MIRPVVTVVRIRRITAVAALIVGAATVVVPAVPAVAVQARPTDLTVVYRSAPDAPAQFMHLQCNPSGGDQPRAAEACSALASAQAGGRDPFQAPSADRVCAVEYDGPQTARVVGRWGGEPVDSSFNRTNECENARWKMIEPVLEPARSS